MLVYRYFNEEHGLQALQEGKLKVGRLLELNDPLDCQPLFVNAPEHFSSADRSQYVKERLQQFNDIVGVFCYSETISDPVVWSHYADGHRGMAFGFESEMGHKIFKVRYPSDNARPQIDFGELGHLSNLDSEDAKLFDLISDGFAVKAKSWEYEREHRAFVYLGGRCEVVGRQYFLRIVPLTFKRIVLGVRSTLSILDVQRILAQRDFAKYVEISKAKTSDANFELIT